LAWGLGGSAGMDARTARLRSGGRRACAAVGAVGLRWRPVAEQSTEANEEQIMLVLSRQRDETIMIGDEIEITVVDIRGDKVRLGIAAPSRIAVHRKEVYEAIRRENEQAAALDERDLSGVRPSVDAIAAGPQRRRKASDLAAGRSESVTGNGEKDKSNPDASAHGRRTA